MRAILSVYDKTGIEDFARGLHGLGWELVSTGGTRRALEAAGIPVTGIEDLTESPEMMDGRVKTLHPRVHGGILYRRGHDGDEAERARHAIPAVDLVAVNLYPFVATVTADPPPSLAGALEEIDIGGPTMLRAAAKNHPSVWPVADPADYGAVLAALGAGDAGGTGEAGAALRRRLAAYAFQHVAHYDTQVAEYLRAPQAAEDPFPAQLTVAGTRLEVLRYGENPHQRGAFYRLDSVHRPLEGIGGAQQHHGKALSYVNVLDADAAYNLVCDFDRPAVAIIKHTNPCCFAVGEPGESLAQVYERALAQGDGVSAYGGIVAANREIDLPWATALRDVRSPVTGERMFYEIVIAPGATAEGLDHLRKKSRDLRILTAPAGDPFRLRPDIRAVRGGLLVQDADVAGPPPMEVVSRRAPEPREAADLATAWMVCKHVKSNAIVFVRDGVLVGMGPGQPNRVESARLAARGAGERAAGAAMASDAFFPFPDSLEVAAAAGVTAVAHPGGSIRDDEAVAAADRLGLALVTTGRRHFRH